MKVLVLTFFHSTAFKEFCGRGNFLFANSSSEMITFQTEAPPPSNIRKKALLIVKARDDTKEAGFPTGISNEIVFMEINKPILNNLYDMSTVSKLTTSCKDLS